MWVCVLCVCGICLWCMCVYMYVCISVCGLCLWCIYTCAVYGFVCVCMFVCGLCLWYICVCGVCVCVVYRSAMCVCGLCLCVCGVYVCDVCVCVCVCVCVWCVRLPHLVCSRQGLGICKLEGSAHGSYHHFEGCPDLAFSSWRNTSPGSWHFGEGHTAGKRRSRAQLTDSSSMRIVISHPHIPVCSQLEITLSCSQ
jgi:GINS complex subunit 2